MEDLQKDEIYKIMLKTKVDYILACYVLKENNLLNMNCLCDCEFIEFPYHMMYELRYKPKTVKQINTIHMLAKKEPNFYNINMSKGFYCASFYVNKKTATLLSFPIKCGAQALTNKMLLNAISFQQKSPATYNGNWGSFVLSFVFWKFLYL